MTRFTLIAAVAAFFSNLALAAPTAYPRNPDQLKGVVNDTSSSLMGDTDDPKMGWVLPPAAGTVTPGKLTGASANLGKCGEMADLQQYSRILTAKIAENALKIADSESEVDAKKTAYEQAQKAQADLAASSGDAQKIQSLTDRESDLENQISQLITQQEAQCSTADSPACTNLDAQIKTLQAEHRKVVAELQDVRNGARSAYQAFVRAKARTDAAKEALDDAFSTLESINAKVIEARKEMGDMYADYAKFEGGYTSIVYDTGWDANVQQLRDRNSTHRFEPVRTRNARIQAGLIGGADKDSYLASLPIVLDYTFNGAKFLPYGSGGEQDLAAMPSRMSATLRLSLTGACPMIHPESFDIPKSAQGMPLFAIAASYDYPAAFLEKVTFSFNLYKFYQKMQSSGSSGGLFWSSSWSKVSENDIGHDAFSADWFQSDPDNQISLDDRRKVEAEVKQELMNRVLRQIATPVFDGAAQLAAAPPVPEHGALVLAQGLSETCGWYSFYCTGGAWLLRGLDSIFGSSSTEQTYQQTYDVTSTETWSNDSVRWKPGVTVFVGNNG